jgi:hypothetical protein
MDGQARFGHLALLRERDLVRKSTVDASVQLPPLCRQPLLAPLKLQELKLKYLETDEFGSSHHRMYRNGCDAA